MTWTPRWRSSTPRTPGSRSYNLDAPLENAASRADARLNALFADRRFDEIGALFADDIRVEDRRRGLRHEGNDRAFAVAEVRAIADVGTKSMTSDVLAIRGERLALVRTLHLGRDQRPEAFHTELLRIVEIDADERIVAHIAFDLDDIDAAFAELDARYLAGEAAAHAHTWSVVAGAFAALNRHELPSTTPDFVDIDHRRGSVRAGEVSAFVRASWDLMPDMHLPHRGRASAKQSRSGGHPRFKGNLTRGLRRRVARNQRCHGRRRSAHPLRTIRRGRHRRRAREVR